MTVHRRARRWVLTLATCLGVAIPAAVTLGASPAAAALGSCAYPYVCVYTANGTKVGQFQDFTSYFQGFSRTDIAFAYNTRHDDVAYFRYNSGHISCVEPGRQADLRISGWGYVSGIRITTNPTCTFPPPA